MNYTKGQITIGGVNFIFNAFGDTDESKLLEIRKLAEGIKLGDKAVKDFYESASNTYKFDIKGINETIQTNVSTLIQEMKVNREQLEEVAEDEFMEFIRTVTAVTKILTSIYVLVMVKKTACGSGKNVGQLEENQDTEIKRLKALLLETSNLLFNLDRIDDKDS